VLLLIVMRSLLVLWLRPEGPLYSCMIKESARERKCR
jgi:hypothetical protein